MINFKQIIILLSIFFSASLYAQQGMVMYNMDNVPQSNYLNPAFDTGLKRSIGLPGISSIYINAKNTFFQPGVLFSNDEGLVNFNKDEYLNSLEDENYFGVNAAVDLLSFQQKIGKLNFLLSIRERLNVRATLPHDFLAFPFTGNANFELLENGTLDFSGMKLDVMHYREIGIGARGKIGHKLQLGGKVKFLYGYENIDFEKSDIVWKTNEVNWDWEISGQVEVNTSGVVSDTTASGDASPKDYALKKKNRGLGLDLGAVYQVNKKLDISASIVDFGYIKWKTDIETTQTNDARFIYSGLELTEDVILAGGGASDSIDVAVEQLEEDFKDTFTYSTNTAAYKTSLLTQTNVAIHYKLINSERFEGKAVLMLHTEYYKGQINNSVGLSYNQKMGKHINALLSYSVINNDFKNLGAGLMLSASKFQLYAAVDNLMALNLTRIKTDQEDAGIPIPTYSKNVHFQVGINLIFPEKK